MFKKSLEAFRGRSYQTVKDDGIAEADIDNLLGLGDEIGRGVYVQVVPGAILY